MLFLLIGVLSFSTMQAQNVLTINMEDSFGDGWNGGELSIFSYSADGCMTTLVAGPFTIATGSTGTETADLPDGCYKVIVTPGSFPSEISWTIDDATPATILSGGAPFEGDLNINGTCPATPVFGCTDPAASNYDPAATCDDGSCITCADNLLTITMEDSFGDGWNGAELTINSYSADGCSSTLLEGPFTIITGSIGTEQICLPDGCYQVVVTGGSFPSEVSWTIDDATPATILSGGAPFEGNLNINGTCPAAPVFGCTDPAAGNYDPLATCDDGSCALCPDPTGVAVANITGTGAEVSWVAGSAGVTTTTVTICPAGVTPPDAACTEYTSATNPQVITGLTECTTYDAFVQETCGPSDSALVGPITFSTEGAPVGLTPTCGDLVSYPACLDGYAAFEDVTFTVCPAAGEYVGVSFTFVDIESNATCSWDALNISTPSGSEGPLCGEPDGDGGPGSGLVPGDCFFAGNADECITIVFTSDSGVQEAGFAFQVICDQASGADACAAAGSSTPLPVELVSFDAKAMDTENMITWRTASEENTQWHNIERSVNGQSDWNVIGRVAAAGTSSEILSYDYMDAQPLAVAYYRLRSVDYDAYESMSAVVRVERERISGDISVYPNPTKGTANVDFDLAQNESVIVTLTDITGKVISYQTISAQRGSNNHQVEMGSLSNGIYFISMESSLGKMTQRIVKH